MYNLNDLNKLKAYSKKIKIAPNNKKVFLNNGFLFKGDLLFHKKKFNQAFLNYKSIMPAKDDPISVLIPGRIIISYFEKQKKNGNLFETVLKNNSLGKLRNETYSLAKHSNDGEKKYWLNYNKEYNYFRNSYLKDKLKSIIVNFSVFIFI